MSERVFQFLSIGLAVGFTVLFAIVVVPPLVADPDVLGAFAAGFVNPYASGYASDVFFCWTALAVWIAHEAKAYSVRHGWVCLVLGIVPGVAVGLALYLVLRSRQLRQTGCGA
jgi:hypothetical protein